VLQIQQILSMDNDDITLPADTLAILNQFLAERTQREHDEEQRMVNQTGKDAHFEEDWVQKLTAIMYLIYSLTYFFSNSVSFGTVRERNVQ